MRSYLPFFCTLVPSCASEGELFAAMQAAAVRPAATRLAVGHEARRRSLVASAAAALLLLVTCGAALVARPPQAWVPLASELIADGMSSSVARAALNSIYQHSDATSIPHNGHGLKLEHAVQSVLAGMASGGAKAVVVGKGGLDTATAAQKMAQIYDADADPEAPSWSVNRVMARNEGTARPKSQFAKVMQARMSVAKQMEAQLKLKAQVAELSPKYMPKEQHPVMNEMLALKPHAHDAQQLSKEKARAALYAKKRALEKSWLKYNWAVNGPPKKPGFDFMQKLVAKDMERGVPIAKMEAAEKDAMNKYRKLARSYATWQQLHYKYGTE